jgi:hypothetical protein
VISSPTAYQDVQQELIAEILQTAIWPVVFTSDGNISITNKTVSIDRNGSYIILIPDGNITNLEAEMRGLVTDRRKYFTRIWNSEARFVVASASEFSMLQQTEILDYFSKLRIYNCIIVSREHYDIDKEYSSQIKANDVDTGIKLKVYTWFPYQSSDRCTEVKNITLLDSWFISAQGHFTKNTDLFSEKISKTLNGCSMTAVVRDAEWEFTTDFVNYTDSNGNVVTEIYGTESFLLKFVLEQMNMTIKYVPTPKGFEIEEGLTDNLTIAMYKKEAYIALGAVGTYYLNDPYLDSTNSYHIMRFRWYVPCHVKYSRWSSIFRIFSAELWLVLIISIVIAAISTTLVGRYSCTSEWERYKTVTSSLTNVWAVILGVSVSKTPRAPSLRSLFLAWLFFSLSFNTVFQAFLTTFLIDSGYEKPIQNKNELYESGMKLYYEKDLNNFFENGEETEVSKVQRDRANCSSYWDCVLWAKYHKNVSILAPDLELKLYYAVGFMLDEDSEPLMCKLEDGVVYNDGLRMLMLHGDPLLKRFSEIIDRVVEAGLYNYWISKEFYSYTSHTEMKANGDTHEVYYSYKLYHMQPAFYLLLIGWCLSALCFMVELFYNRILSKRK